MHEALLFSQSDDEAVVCRLCPRHCRIESGDRGFCGVRENVAGTLYANSYGKLTAAGLDPVEKKPLYHYLPGTQTFSLSSYGCNFTCRPLSMHWMFSGRRTPQGSVLRSSPTGT